jgi:carbon-monoxide dehydrogenase large subunit
MIGQPLPRLEDERLLRGRGCYTDDRQLPGQLHAAFLRSPHAHARIGSIDVEAARAMPGVMAVLTAADAAADGLQPMPHTAWSIHPAELQLPNLDGSPTFVAPHHLLARDKARFVGEPVALVVARTAHEAHDALEAIAIDWQPLPSASDAREALAPGAPPVWDELPGNTCIVSAAGDAAGCERAFAQAAHVVRLSTHVQRVTGVPMEPRSALAMFDNETGRTTLYTGSGAVARLKADLATVLAVSPEQVRVVIGDVGGNYGTRGGFYPEYALVCWAARRLGQPVRWTALRHEAMLSDYQGRDLTIEAELALSVEGDFLALRGEVISNIGAHTVSFATLQKSVEVLSGLYAIPFARFSARGVLTHTVPTRPYRATGRPEAMYVIERLIDEAARQCGFDRVTLRRRNLIASHQLPWTNPFGMTYDNGEYEAGMDAALELGDWAGFAARREASRARGLLRGIGIANYVDTGTGVTRERAEVRIDAEGLVTLVIGTISNGQGHETTYAQLLTQWLGVPLRSIRVVMGDTDQVVFGGGSHSGRSMRLASIVIREACDQLLASAREAAAQRLGRDASTMRFEHGHWCAGDEAGCDGLAVSLTDLARDTPLGGLSDRLVTEAAFPYGCHVCEVEIDPETGIVRLDRYAALDDVGLAVNPLVIDGQTHGGIVQGVGQVLGEHACHDPASGQPLAASFLDYVMPRADTLPSFSTRISEVPASSHPLGIRPGGEGGTTPALAVVSNAIMDALAFAGARHIDMPITAERVWRALQAQN